MMSGHPQARRRGRGPEMRVESTGRASVYLNSVSKQGFGWTVRDSQGKQAFASNAENSGFYLKGK